MWATRSSSAQPAGGRQCPLESGVSPPYLGIWWATQIGAAHRTCPSVICPLPSGRSSRFLPRGGRSSRLLHRFCDEGEDNGPRTRNHLRPRRRVLRRARCVSREREREREKMRVYRWGISAAICTGKTEGGRRGKRRERPRFSTHPVRARALMCVSSPFPLFRPSFLPFFISLPLFTPLRSSSWR